MSQPLQKGCGDEGQQSHATTPKCSEDGLPRAGGGRDGAPLCLPALPSRWLKENSQGHSLTLDKPVRSEHNEKQEVQNQMLTRSAQTQAVGGCGSWRDA